MSARSATTGPGLPPFKTATTPVFATPVFGLSPILINSLVILSAVLNSLLLNSGFWWNQCLSSIILDSISDDNVFIFLSKDCALNMMVLIKKKVTKILLTGNMLDNTNQTLSMRFRTRYIQIITHKKTKIEKKNTISLALIKFFCLNIAKIINISKI